MPARDLFRRTVDLRRSVGGHTVFRTRMRTTSGVPADASVRVIRSQQLRTSALLLLALLVILAGLHVVLSGTSWWFTVALLVIVLIAVTAVVRRVFGAQRQNLPPLVAGVLLVATVTFFFAPQDAILLFIPTPETLADFGALFTEANLSISRQSIPANAIGPILFLLCLGVGAIVIVADFLANTLRTPALAGIPLLVLLAVPSAITVDAIDPIVFVGAALAYLALLAPHRSRPSRFTLPLAGFIVIGALIIPLALPDVTPAEGNGPGFSTGVNPVITLGQNLRQDIEHTVLTYSTRSGNSEYLRLVNIDSFEGREWGPSQFTLNRSNTPGQFGPAQGLSTDVKTVRETTNVSVEGLTSPWLPLPYPTSRVTGLQGDWYWDPNGLVVRSPSRTAQNQSYEATSVTIEPTPQQLESAGTTVPPDFGRYLALPNRMPSIIAATAQSVAGQAPSNYQKALLLQDFFRNGNFEYSETAPIADGYDGTSMRVIADFLQARSGYCVHFASAMAVMARSLGIPARIAVGFLPGSRSTNPVDGTDLFTVTSHNLHAWPELYFEGIGWTRFEPTVSRGNLPDYADIASGNVPTPVNSTPTNALPNAVPSAAAPSTAPSRGAEAGAGGSGTTVETNSTTLWFSLTVIFLALLLLLPAAVRTIVRHRRLRVIRTGGTSALVGWREVLDSAEDLGIVVPNTATPRETAMLLATASTPKVRPVSAVRATPSDAATPSVALDRLRQAVERQSYSNSAAVNAADSVRAPSASALSSAERSGATDVIAEALVAAADVETVVAQLRAAASGARRWRSLLIPRSTWRRIRKVISPAGP